MALSSQMDARSISERRRANFYNMKRKISEINSNHVQLEKQFADMRKMFQEKVTANQIVAVAIQEYWSRPSNRG